MTQADARPNPAFRAASAALTLVPLTAAQPAAACAVCFGNPESPLTKGVGAGVLVLVGVVSVLLLGVASVAAFWTIRARRFHRRG